jgi:hypothetical protein
MNTRLATAAALLAALTAPLAMAQEATPDTWQAVTASSVSREAVRADAIAALKAGLIERGEASVVRTEFRSTQPRAQVAAEAREALRLGVVSFGEGPGAVATPAQADAIRLAGQQALGQAIAQAGR